VGLFDPRDSKFQSFLGEGGPNFVSVVFLVGLFDPRDSKFQSFLGEGPPPKVDKIACLLACHYRPKK
jgi:hypothetical protein